MDKRNRRSRRAMRDVLKLRDVLSGIVDTGGRQAHAARRLLHWASAQQKAAAATADDDDYDDAADADDAGDAADDARRQQQRLHQQRQQHQQQQQPPWQQQQLADGSSGSPQLGAADGDAEATGAAMSAPTARQQQRQQQPQQRGQQQQQQLQQQQQQPDGSTSITIDATWQPQLLSRAGPEQWEQWAFRRRSGSFYKNQCGAGNAAGTREALLRYSTLSTRCCAPGCSALVDIKVARRQAKQDGRKSFGHGDGCAGPECSADHRPARFAKRQREQAAALEAGERLLIRWPASVDDREVWFYSAEAALEAAAAARAAL